MAQEGSRPSSWVNPNRVKDETEWVDMLRDGAPKHSAMQEKIAKLRRPYSNFLPTAPHAAFELRGPALSDPMASDPFILRDPWKGLPLPKQAPQNGGDAWAGYQGLQAGRATSSLDPFGSIHSRAFVPSGD